MNISNMTPAEQWRVNGAFDRETAEHLLDQNALIEGISAKTSIAAIDEAVACLPAEDLLTTHLVELAKLVKSTRGSNKDAAQDLFNELHALAEQVRQDTEYAKEKLDELKKALKGLD